MNDVWSRRRYPPVRSAGANVSTYTQRNHTQKELDATIPVCLFKDYTGAKNAANEAVNLKQT